MPGNSAFQRSRRRLTAAVTGISVAMVAVLGLDLVEARRQAVEKARVVSDNMSLLLSERLDGSVREADYVLRDIIDKVRESPWAAALRTAVGPLSPTELLPPGSRSRELDLLVAAKRATLPQASSLAILDPAGRPIAINPSNPGDSAVRSYVRDFAEDGSLDATTPAAYGDAGGGALGAALIRARAVRDEGGALVAVAAARIDVSLIQRELADLELGEHRIIAVTDPELRLIARKPEMPNAVGAEVVDPDMRRLLRSLKEARPGRRSMSSETGPCFYYARVGEFPFFIVIGAARSDIMAEWKKRLAVYGIAAAMIVALMILLARLMNRNISRSAELAARFVAMESASDMIVIADLEGRAEYVNPSFERVTGLPKSEALGSRRAIFGPDETEARFALAAAAAGDSWRGEIAAAGPEGESLVEEVTISPVLGPDGAPVRIVAILRDVTDRRRLQERLEQLAHYDPLTALPNRALFIDRLEGAVARARREDRRFALLFIDLDGFKAVNDRFGHDAGDYLLFEIAQRLKAAIRDSDTAGRMGGDEFTVLLDTISRPEDTSVVADKIEAELTRPIRIPAGAEVSVGASIGISVFPDDGTNAETLLKAADSLMYEKKLASGGHR